MQSCRSGPEPVAARPAEGHRGLHGSGRDARNGKRRHGWAGPPAPEAAEPAATGMEPGMCGILSVSAPAGSAADGLLALLLFPCRRLSDVCVGDERRPEHHVPRRNPGDAEPCQRRCGDDGSQLVERACASEAGEGIRIDMAAGKGDVGLRQHVCLVKPAFRLGDAAGILDRIHPMLPVPGSCDIASD